MQATHEQPRAANNHASPNHIDRTTTRTTMIKLGISGPAPTAAIPNPKLRYVLSMDRGLWYTFPEDARKVQVFQSAGRLVIEFGRSGGRPSDAIQNSRWVVVQLGTRMGVEAPQNNRTRSLDLEAVVEGNRIVTVQGLPQILRPTEMPTIDPAKLAGAQLVRRDEVERREAEKRAAATRPLPEQKPPVAVGPILPVADAPKSNAAIVAEKLFSFKPKPAPTVEAKPEPPKPPVPTQPVAAGPSPHSPVAEHRVIWKPASTQPDLQLQVDLGPIDRASFNDSDVVSLLEMIESCQKARPDVHFYVDEAGKIHAGQKTIVIRPFTPRQASA